MKKLILLLLLVTAAHAWEPREAPLMTRWGKQVNPSNVLPEYPRPQLVRPRWKNLNGLWEYAIGGMEQPRPEKPQGTILVPFPVESALSGVGKRVNPEQKLWYFTEFEVPPDWKGQRVLLHFGAVDWQTTVRVNDELVGKHEGGYDPFTFDITDALKEGEQELSVEVWDPSDAGGQPRGKQVVRPSGIWYTPVTGIWQTVWIEPVPQTYIRSLKITPTLRTVTIQANLSQPTDWEASFNGATYRAAAGQPLTIQVDAPKLWSPESPHLYNLEVKAREDQVKTYFGLREIKLGHDEHGHAHMLFNGKPVFQFGLLDQGWWPDGLYTAPSDAALKYDIEMTKKLGFNMARKHVKTEPARWYYHCDTLGLLVWQDMPSGGPEAPWHPEGHHDNTDLVRPRQTVQNFEREWQAIVEALYNHPCIVVWVPFNEGWGQFDTERIVRWTEKLDPTRLVNTASGGNDFPVGHIRDIHRYPGPAAPPPEKSRAIVLGEYGGLGLPVKGHLWQDRDNWGYRTYQTVDELNREYVALLKKLRALPELSGAIYTQTTDVEGEVNGMMTYDREVLKLDPARVLEATRELYRERSYR